tara:strand:+ start:6098 stop:7519 length:1422 start_codon:yes stop_codon:yes gene_type:complete
MKTLFFWAVSIIVTYIGVNQTDSYIAFICPFFIITRVIYELWKFPRNAVSYTFLHHAKALYDRDTLFLKKQNELLSEELKISTNKTINLNNQQNSVLIQSESKLIEAEFLTKKLLYQKQVFHFIGHDLKAPFQNIISFLTKSNTKGSKDFILRNAEHGLSLIEEILETKKESVFKRPKGKNRFLPSHVNDLIRQFDLTEITSVNYSDNVDKIPFDTNKSLKTLDQTLSNLLSNIKKYAISSDVEKDNDMKEIFISFCLGKFPGYIDLEVTDSGPGIPKDIREKLFKQKFKSSKKGHGRGLYQLKKFLNDHNGDISISQNTDDAQFIVNLPILTLSSDEKVISEIKATKKSINKSLNVLIIDDSIDIHQILGLFLEEIYENVQIHSATNLNEAIELDTKYEYDLCFLDMNLKEISGEHVFRQLTKIKHKTPVVAISASFEKEKIQQLKKIGIYNVMSKSFNEEIIKRVINDSLG